MKISDLLPEEVKSLIEEYNTNSKFNTFLYNNPDCDKVFTKMISGSNRFILVSRMGKIEKELIPFVVSLHNKEVIITNGTSHLTGKIQHLPTREYKGEILPNCVSFRREYEDIKCSAPETIALWIDTGNKFTSHLYTINNIELIGE